MCQEMSMVMATEAYEINKSKTGHPVVDDVIDDKNAHHQECRPKDRPYFCCHFFPSCSSKHVIIGIIDAAIVHLDLKKLYNLFLLEP